jgi:hypothetical protein
MPKKFGTYMIKPMIIAVIPAKKQLPAMSLMKPILS